MSVLSLLQTRQPKTFHHFLSAFYMSFEKESDMLNTIRNLNLASLKVVKQLLTLLSLFSSSKPYKSMHKILPKDVPENVPTLQ